MADGSVPDDAGATRRKLGIRPGACVALVGAPEGMARALGLESTAIELGTPDDPPLDVILRFATERAELAGEFAMLAARLAPAGGLWICWPKRAARVPTDLTDDVVRAIGLAAGLVDNKVCAVDMIWSGQRFVVRVADRAGWGRQVGARDAKAPRENGSEARR